MARRALRTLGIVVLILLLLIPLGVAAFPYGGLIYLTYYCFNGVIYAGTGPPRGGPFIWTGFTRTYRFGAPTHPGQWHLGLAGPPYFCLVSISPIITLPGLTIIMMGSSR